MNEVIMGVMLFIIIAFCFTCYFSIKGLYFYFKSMFATFKMTIKIYKLKYRNIIPFKLFTIGFFAAFIPIFNKEYVLMLNEMYEDILKEKYSKQKNKFIFTSLSEIKDYLKLDEKYNDLLFNMITLVKMMEYEVDMWIDKNYRNPSNASEILHQLFIRIKRPKNGTIIFTTNFETNWHFDPKPVMIAKHELNLDGLYLSGTEYDFMINLIEQRL